MEHTFDVLVCGCDVCIIDRYGNTFKKNKACHYGHIIGACVLLLLANIGNSQKKINKQAKIMPVMVTSMMGL